MSDGMSMDPVERRIYNEGREDERERVTAWLDQRIQTWPDHSHARQALYELRVCIQSGEEAPK